ncbi:hypothetical protein KDA23_01695 [Candidatus Saccharibacteria bacterium]|nr:hypothetical protein [Candidatus Saccharibacteria bacterium]
MMLQKQAIIRLLFAVIGLLAAYTIWGSPTSYAALSSIPNQALTLDSINLVDNVSPSVDQSSLTASHPWHTLLLTGHGSVQKIDVGMYFKNNTADKDFHFNVSGPFCNIDAPGSYAASRPYIYIVVKSKGVTHKLTPVDGDEVCNGTFDANVYTIKSAWLQKNYGGTDLYGATVTVRWVQYTDNTNVVPKNVRTLIAKQNGGVGSNVRFRISANNATARVGYVDTSSSNSSNTNNSIVHAETNNSGYENIFYPFGLRCNEAAKPGGEITVYDADNGTSGQSQSLYFFVGTVAQGGKVITPLRNNDYRAYSNGSLAKESPANQPRTSPPLNSDIDPNNLVSYPYGGANANGIPVFTPSGFDNVGGSTSIKINIVQPETHYVLVVAQMHNGQFVYVGLPGDAIFGSPDFDYSTDCPATGSMSCSLTSTVGDTVDTYTPISVDMSTSYGPAGFTPTNVTLQLELEADDPTFAVRSYGPFSDGSPPFGRTFNIGTLPLGEYDLTGTVNYRDSVNEAQDSDCPLHITVANTPYLSVYGGDAVAGAYEMNGSGTCSINQNAGFISWNSGSDPPTTSGDTFRGAGTQLAATALGPIRFFATALNAPPSNSNPRKPESLAFANVGTSTDALGSVRTVLDVDGGRYGGYFSNFSPVDDSSCSFLDGISTAAKPGGQVHGDIISLLNSNGGFVPAGEHVFYAYSDVLITNPIRYANSGSWSNLSSIPSFKLVVVGGNILIRGDVSQLDGLYVAEPDGSGNGGNIYTCASNSGVPADITDPGTYDLCNHKLTINGAFAAKQIQFLRTTGSVGQAQNNSSNEANAAEVFHYSPEMWLPRPSSLNPNWTAVSGLPPVL